jgi:hypothetical protein
MRSIGMVIIECWTTWVFTVDAKQKVGWKLTMSQWLDRVNGRGWLRNCRLPSKREITTLSTRIHWAEFHGVDRTVVFSTRMTSISFWLITQLWVLSSSSCSNCRAPPSELPRHQGKVHRSYLSVRHRQFCQQSDCDYSNNASMRATTAERAFDHR